jgi:signal transduction histidine kinase
MPKSGPGVRSANTVYEVVLFGTYAVVLIMSVLALISWGLGRQHSPGVLISCVIAALYVVAIRVLARGSRYWAVAHMIVAFYGLLGAGIIWSWGINTPIGLLIFCVVIVLAGILLTARNALYAAVAAGSVLLAVQTAVVVGWHVPNMTWTGKESSYADAIGSCVIFGMLALISWLYNREMERSLLLAKQAEAALLRQKAMLRRKVEERTAQLRQSQMIEMRQMYRFAELGQLGVMLLHDLANHLTALTLEIENLQNKQNTDTIAHAREIMEYLEDVVDSARDRLHGGVQKQRFNVIEKIDKVTVLLAYKASRAGVSIDWRPRLRRLDYEGDIACFSQIVAIILSNAIDSYQDTTTDVRRVEISVKLDAKNITISVGDWGRGIAKSQQKSLFKPFNTTKKSGLGIGLFIARQTIVNNFGGSITLNPKSDHTEFVIKLPVENAK